MPCALVVAGLLSVEAGFVVDDDVSLPAGRAAFGADVFSGSSACLTWPSKMAFGWMLRDA